LQIFMWNSPSERKRENLSCNLKNLKIFRVKYLLLIAFSRVDKFTLGKAKILQFHSTPKNFYLRENWGQIQSFNFPWGTLRYLVDWIEKTKATKEILCG
jgi:hypothetical protein